jgi:hypothetical protein
MWERIMISGGLIIGAIILFIAFTAALFILERREMKRNKRKAQIARIVHMQNSKRAA